MPNQVILIDDEAIIRNGLRKFTDWAKFDFEICADFSDGKEAIAYLETHHVDLIITDIKMVEKSGIDVAEYVFTNSLPTKVILLSGYKEFDYAQQAIRFGVTHYLLKPIDQEEIDKTLFLMRQEIALMHESVEKRKKTTEYFAHIVPLARQEFFNDLYAGALQNKLIFTRHLAIAGLDNACSYQSYLLDITIDNYQQALLHYSFGKERLKQEVVTFLIDQQAEEFYLVYSRSQNMKMIAFSEKNQLAPPTQFLRNTEAICAQVQDLIGVHLTVRLEKAFDSLLEISTYRNNTVNAISTQSLPDTSPHLSISDREHLQKKCKALVESFFASNTAAPQTQLQEIEKELHELPLPEYRALYLCIFHDLQKQLADSSISIDPQKVSGLEIFLQEESNTKESIFQHFSKLLNEIEQSIQQNVNLSQKQIVQSIQHYIRENLQRQISLESIAENTYVSASYASRIFKQVTGKTIMDYVIESRIERAILLLKSNQYKIYEISELVGYSSVQYFTRQFKLVTGTSPKQFIRKSQKDTL